MGWNLGELIAKYDVPGAQVAVLAGGEIQDEAAGVLSLRTQVETTTDSVFQIGSITKIWTATLVQQLVREGRLDLDLPVRTYLPGFRLNTDANASLTTRHLLTHTSGIDANLFVDSGTNPDTLERFTAALQAADHPFAPGTVFSYSNAAYMLLGRLLEVLHGKPFHDVLRERLVTPLGLHSVATNAFEAIMHRAAVGHHQVDGEIVPVSRWAPPYANGPSGSQLVMSARDLMEFIRLHLTDPALAVMREPQVAPIPNFGQDIEAYGLGWMIYGDGVTGHTGSTKGQKAFVRTSPETGVAVAVLTNSQGGGAVAHEIITDVLHDLAGIRTPEPPVPPARPAPIEPWMCGTYRTTLYDITLHAEGVLVFVPRNELARSFLGKDENRIEVVRLDETAVITAAADLTGHQVYALIDRDERGLPRFLHNGAAAQRIA